MSTITKISLTEISEKYSTDKKEHGYLKYYEWHLPESVNKLLEIGCLRGESMRMWHEFYPEAELHTLDLFEEFKEPDYDWLITHKGNQTDVNLMKQLAKYNFDVIIDDGSHNAQDQIISLEAMNFKYKMYVIEDLHCNEDEFYRNGMAFEDTILGQIKADKFNYAYRLYDDKIVFIFNSLIEL